MIPLAPPASAPPPAAAVAPPVPYGFGGAGLGMDMAAWRASSPARAAATCAGADAQVQTCRTADQPLGSARRARDLTSTFVDGRLAAIAFTTSVDSFAVAVAQLTQSFGAPSRTVHDRARLADGRVMPHVAMTWRNGRSTIRLSDPAGRGGSMRVRYVLDAAASRLQPAGASVPSAAPGAGPA